MGVPPGTGGGQSCLVGAVIVFLGVAVALTTGHKILSFSGDGCDWTGSGLHQEESRGVQPVYLRCAQGTIHWRYPRGALRVVLRHGTSGKDFRGCIRVSRHFGGAQIYLEGHRKLHPIFSKSDKRPLDLLRCFTSYHGQVALYVEAEPVLNVLQKDVAEFSYDLRPASPEALQDEMEECRPCTEEELLRYYCTSDFVVRGTIGSLLHDERLQRSELTVYAKKVIRDSEPPLFPTGNTSAIGGITPIAVLQRPLKCGTKVGSGEFLFLGRWLLGNPVIRCAPRLSEWKHVRRKALVDGTNQCQLD